MDQVTWADGLSAVAAGATALLTFALVLFAAFAWRTARKALKAAEAAATASRDAADQARRSVEAMERDSDQRTAQNERATRPYVYARLVPALAGSQSLGWDLVLENAGASAAYDVTMLLQGVDQKDDVVATANRKLANSGQMLAPGQRLRTMWYFPKDRHSDPAEPIGFRRATVTLKYRNADPASSPYEDSPIVLDPEEIGMTPTPSRGAESKATNPIRRNGRDMVLVLRQVSEYIGELSR